MILASFIVINVIASLTFHEQLGNFVLVFVFVVVVVFLFSWLQRTSLFIILQGQQGVPGFKPHA